MAMAEELVNHGVHALGIKDMAGVLKPRAASQVGPRSLTYLMPSRLHLL